MEILILFIFIVGIFIGSFLHVLAFRLPRDEGVIFGRSYCESCKHQLSSLDLIPLFSFLFLKGKCRYCHKKLSWYYPFGEFLTGVLYVLVFLHFGSASLVFLLYIFFVVSCLIVIFSADYLYGIIPDKIVYPAIFVTLLIYSYLYGANISGYISSGLGAGGFFLLLFLITRGKGMGFGDVKLALLLGLVLGFPFIVYSLYIAFLTGAGVSLILILWKKKHLKSTIPFGPFLVFGALVVILFPALIKQISSMVLPL